MVHPQSRIALLHLLRKKNTPGVNPDTGKAMYYRNQEIPQEDGSVIVDRSLTESASEAQAIPYSRLTRKCLAV